MRCVCGRLAIAIVINGLFETPLGKEKESNKKEIEDEKQENVVK